MSIRDLLTGTAARLSAGSLAALVAALVACYLVLSTFIQYRKLQHIKGPWLAAVSPAWLFYHTCRGDLYLATEAALKKYGSVRRTLAGHQLTAQARPCALRPTSWQPMIPPPSATWLHRARPGEKAAGSEA